MTTQTREIKIWVYEGVRYLFVNGITYVAMKDVDDMLSAIQENLQENLEDAKKALNESD